MEINKFDLSWNTESIKNQIAFWLLFYEEIKKRKWSMKPWLVQEKEEKMKVHCFLSYTCYVQTAPLTQLSPLREFFFQAFQRKLISG